MAKAPIPGQVKTRLMPALTAQQAAAFYGAMLQDTIANCSRRAPAWTLHAAVAPAPPQPGLRFPAAWHVFPQGRGHLGVRLQAAFQRIMQGGAARVIAVGVDSPTLPEMFVSRAFDALARADVVLGPTEDGGCYAIGLRTAPRAWLRGVPWSTADVCHALAARARRLGWSIRYLPRWYDIDTIEDMARHRVELRRTRRAPRTRAWFRRYASVAGASVV